jgi:hypothetical protein
MRDHSLRSLLPLALLALATMLIAACQPALTASGDGQTEAVDATLVGRYVDDGGKTGIRGRIVLKDDGSPVAGGYVNVYPDTISNLLGPSQFISTPTDAAGFYQIEVPPGVYYVVARKRVSGQATGPLSPGDYYSEHQRQATRVVAGKVVEIELPVAVMKAPMFFKNRTVAEETDTGIRGVLVDAAGKPVMGGFAMAYNDQKMKRLPDFTSTLSDLQGRFTIYLPAGGRFFLAARIHAWDMPSPGEPYGQYGGEQAIAVDVADREFVSDIKIVMTPFAGEYKPGKSRRPF